VAAVDPYTEQSQTLDVGDEWVISVAILDDDGDPTDATVGTIVTTPSGLISGPVVTEDETGLYTATFTITEAGRHLAVATASGDVVGVCAFTAYASSPTYADSMPTISDVSLYLGDSSETNDALSGALAAEASAQRARCKVPAVYPADLREALLRRVARNLAARAVPIATFTSFEGGGTSSRVPMLDAEIARLEGPYRKRRVG
jgi:hypothetical protein